MEITKRSVDGSEEIHSAILKPSALLAEQIRLSAVEREIYLQHLLNVSRR